MHRSRRKRSTKHFRRPGRYGRARPRARLARLARLVGLVVVVVAFGFGGIFGCGRAALGPAYGPVTAKLTSCSFSDSDDSVHAQVVFWNGTGRDAALTAQVYWLTSAAQPGPGGKDGGLDPRVVGRDYVGDSEQAEADVSAGQSVTVSVTMPLGGGVPAPPGLRCVVADIWNYGVPR